MSDANPPTPMQPDGSHAQQQQDQTCFVLQAPTPAIVPRLDTNGDAQDVELEAVKEEALVANDEAVMAVKQEREAAPTVRTCQFCPSKKHIAAGCVNNACKKCCLGHMEVCSVHPKVDSKAKLLEQLANEQQKAKKPVLKNEFREANFAYYEETVTIFCVRDFFESKRLSQSILNDKDRSRRVNGSFVGQQVRKKSKAVKSPELKAAITSALGKRMAPVVENGNCTATGGEGAVKRQTIASNGS